MSGTVLVTGGAGFIGHHLVNALIDAGWNVRVLDDLSSGKRDQVHPDATFTEGSVLSDSDLDAVLPGADAVVHLAAVPSVPHSVAHPAESTRINEEGTVRVLLAMTRHDVTRMVFASSSAVYGNRTAPPVDASTLTFPDSPYGAAKRGSEIHINAYRHLHGIDAAVFRFFNVFGIGQNPDSDYAAVVPRFIERAGKSESLPIFGDGEQTRDFIYVLDIVSAILTALNAATLPAEPMVLSTGIPTRIQDLAETIIRLSDSSSSVDHLAPRPGDILHSHANHSETTRVLGWSATYSLEQGLEEIIRTGT